MNPIKSKSIKIRPQAGKTRGTCICRMASARRNCATFGPDSPWRQEAKACARMDKSWNETMGEADVSYTPPKIHGWVRFFCKSMLHPKHHGWVIKWAPTSVVAFSIRSYFSLNHDYGGKSSHGETMFWSWWKGCDRKVALSGGSIMNTLTSKCWKTSWKEKQGEIFLFWHHPWEDYIFHIIIFLVSNLQRLWQFRVPKFLSISFLKVSMFAPAVWCSCDVALSPVLNGRNVWPQWYGVLIPIDTCKLCRCFLPVWNKSRSVVFTVHHAMLDVHYKSSMGFCGHITL